MTTAFLLSACLVLVMAGVCACRRADCKTLLCHFKLVCKKNQTSNKCLDMLAKGISQGCNISLCDLPVTGCENGATCVPKAGSAEYSCVCPPGFKGKHCNDTDPCATKWHTVLDETWRMNVPATGKLFCDNMELVNGEWYRFRPGGKDAVVPTSCPPSAVRCSTHKPTWLKMSGPTPQAGEEVKATACSFWDGNCCISEAFQDVIVRNCSGYFVYKLYHFKYCNYAYCTKLI